MTVRTRLAPPARAHKFWRGTVAAFLALALAAIAAPAIAQVEPNGVWAGSLPSSADAVVLPVDGVWHYSQTLLNTQGPNGAGRWMKIPAQDELWTVQSSSDIVIEICDVWVTGDQYELYTMAGETAELVLTTNVVAEYQQPEIEPDVPGTPAPFTNQAAVQSAFGAARYSKGEVTLDAGPWLLNVRSPRYPAGLGAAGFAIRARHAPSTAVGSSTWGAIKGLFR